MLSQEGDHFGSMGALKGGGDGDETDDDDADEAADCARKSVDAPVGMGEQYCGPIPFHSGGADAELVLSDRQGGTLRAPRSSRGMGRSRCTQR